MKTSELGLGDDRIPFTHFRVPGQSLVPLMSNEDVLTLLKYVPTFKEIDVYVKADVSLVEKHMIEVRGIQSKGVMIEEIVEENVVTEPIKKEKLLLLEWNGSTNIQ